MTWESRRDRIDAQSGRNARPLTGDSDTDKIRLHDSRENCKDSISGSKRPFLILAARTYVELDVERVE